MCGSNFCVLFLIRFRHLRSFPFSFDQTMVSIRVQPLHSMASSQSHDHICQKAFSLSLFCVWTFQSIKKKKKKNGRDVTRASHTSRLYPGLYTVIKTMPRMWIQLLCACVLYSYGVTWTKTMGCDVNKSHGRNARFWLVETKFAALWLVTDYRGHHDYFRHLFCSAVIRGIGA